MEATMTIGNDPARTFAPDPRQSTLPGGTGTWSEDDDLRDADLEDEASSGDDDSVFDGGMLDDPTGDDADSGVIPADERELDDMSRRGSGDRPRR
jgi:hypothetical protein